MKEVSWISVKDRLPVNGFCVIFCDIDGYVGYAYYQKDTETWHETWEGNQEMVEITHWMRMPNPPIRTNEPNPS